MSWLIEYARSSAKTDQFKNDPKRVLGLAGGLVGEAGGIVSELKKHIREKSAYPGYGQNLTEELGDFLWYFIRIVELTYPKMLIWMAERKAPEKIASTAFIRLAFLSGEVAYHFSHKKHSDDFRTSLENCWDGLLAVSKVSKIPLELAAERNIEKTASMWPTKPKYHKLFDEEFRPEEQLPRELVVEFIERKSGEKSSVLMKCNNLNMGDRITDNAKEPDFYRYHDVFHFSYMVHLGWSPVIRSLLRCKRKSDKNADENEDGARAAIIEEAVSAVIFATAKRVKFYSDLDIVDFDLLKNIKNITGDHEVSQIPYWQWRMAILDGFRVFRELKKHRNGVLTISLKNRTMTFRPKKTL